MSQPVYKSAMTGPSHRALEVATKETEALIEQGAEAVILTGSHANGTANQYSDVDLRVIGDGPAKRLKRHDEFLVSISWMTLEQHEEGLREPEEVGSVVPGWTSALILHDPEGHAARLKQKAEGWKWDDIADECDGWVAKQITELAEEIHTILGNREQDKPAAAAAERSQVAMGLAETLSVHKRIAYESENELWDLVAEAMGGRYGELQQKSLPLREITLKDSLGAVMQLFAIAAADTQHLLDEEQHAVVARACELAGYPLAPKPAEVPA